MDYSRIFSITGLFLNTLASIVLIWPYITQKHNVNDDFITGMDMKIGNFKQNKHFVERKYNLWGLGLMTLGFLFQLIGILKLNG